jgi:hypothetical protein
MNTPGRPINRPWTPRMPAQGMQTFQVTAPKSTHTRKASCEEVECPQYARGWRMRIDLNTDLGQEQAYYIKHQSGRSYKVISQKDGMVELEFRGGQPCFQDHRVRNSLPEIYRVKGGDFRGNPLRTPVRTHKKPEFWVEEFAENQDRLKTRIERG